MAEPFRTESDPPVRGFLHRPAAPSGNGLVLAHGAGSNCQAPLLVSVAQAFCEAGMLVLRCDLPFRQERPHGPPYPGGAARDREGLRQAVLAMRALAAGRMLLGGHSYGGRQASMLASEDAAVADGLLLLSYPLHPPNRPGQLRTAHFANLRVPALFVHGTRDPFASTEELRAAVNEIPAAATIFEVERAGHDLKGVNVSAIVRQAASVYAAR